MPEIHLRSQMKYLLLDGPIGIGEHHTQPAARLFVADLIERGLVKRLFVEYQTGWQGHMDNLKAGLAAANQNVVDIERQFFFWNQQFRMADAALIDLCVLALLSDADVWCADHWMGGGPPRFPARHQSVRDTYQAKTHGVHVHPKGSVILFGSHHFTDPNEGLDQYIPGLPYHVF